MEKDFFELYEKHEHLELEIGHGPIADWNITVIDRRPIVGSYVTVCNVSGCHREAVFAKAFTELVDYFNDNLGGY